MKTLSYLFIGILMISCSTNKTITQSDSKVNYKRAPLLDQNTFRLTSISTDPKYGYSEKDPIMVGGSKSSEGPKNERRFLNALTGPNGEPVSYYRQGSCCAFKTKNGFNGVGLLDHYSVTYSNSKDTVSIYINMYDYGELKAPVGFSYRE